MEFDYMERRMIESGIKMFKLYQKENTKLNDFDDRWYKISEANIEICNNIMKKIEAEDNKLYPTKLTS